MPETNEYDILTAMLEAQKQLQIQMGYSFEYMTVEETTAYIKEYAMHMEHEMHEMLQELPFFKPWKKYDPSKYEQRCAINLAREEWADVLHHFLNITIALGMSPEMLLAAYSDKRTINYARQKDTENYKPCVGK